MKLHPKWAYVSASFEKDFPIIGSEMWYVIDFPWKIAVIIIQSGLKLYNLTVIAAGVELNKFVIICNRTTWENLNLNNNFFAAQKQGYWSEEH